MTENLPFILLFGFYDFGKSALFDMVLNNREGQCVRHLEVTVNEGFEVNIDVDLEQTDAKLSRVDGVLVETLLNGGLTRARLTAGYSWIATPPAWVQKICSPTRFP